LTGLLGCSLIYEGSSVKLRYRSASGEERGWTFKEIVQGKPLGHPSHALFVHFPAYYIAVLAFDLLTRLQPNDGLVFAATALIIGAFIASVGAVSTGLIDWIGMIPGSRKVTEVAQRLAVSR
jgi:uncharacterized membrane protein